MLVRPLAVLTVCVAAAVSFAATAHGTAGFDCKRVISPAQWQAVLGTSIRVQYGENSHDCLWFHRKPGGSPQGLISGYPAIYRIWHNQIYKQDRTRNYRYADCEYYEVTRTLLRSFHGDFAWTSEYRHYQVPNSRANCSVTTKTLVGIDRNIYVVHHGRLFKLGSQPFTAIAPDR